MQVSQDGNEDFDDISESHNNDDDRRNMPLNDRAPAGLLTKKQSEQTVGLKEKKQQLKATNQQYIRKNKKNDQDTSVSQPNSHKPQSQGDLSFSEESDEQAQPVNQQYPSH